MTNRQQQEMAAYIDKLIQSSPKIGDMKPEQVKHEIEIRDTRIAKLQDENHELNEQDVFYRELSTKSERMTRMKLDINEDVNIDSLDPKQRKLFEYLQNEMINQILNPDSHQNTNSYFREQNIIKEFNKNKAALLKGAQTAVASETLKTANTEKSIADLKGDPTQGDEYNMDLFLKENPITNDFMRVLQNLYKLSDFETSVLQQWTEEPEQKKPEQVKLYSPVISSQELYSVFNKILPMDEDTKTNFFGPRVRAADNSVSRNSSAPEVKEYRKELYGKLREQALKVNNANFQLVTNFESPIDTTKIKAPDTIQSKMSSNQAAAAVLFLSVAGLEADEIKNVMEVRVKKEVTGILKEIATNYDFKSVKKYKSPKVVVSDLRDRFNKAYKQDINLMLSDFIDKGYLGLVDTIKLSNLEAIENKELGKSIKELLEQKSK